MSQDPVVRRTWAPRGQTPILHHTGSNWKRLSIAAALAFRWNGRRTRSYFHTHPGTYTDTAFDPLLRALKRHFRGQRIVLANPCPPDIGALRSPVRAGCARIRRQPELAFGCLDHAGLAL